MKNAKEKIVVAYVHSKDGKVLDPMYSHPRVRHFIKNGKAVIVKRKPFTIRLTYDIENPIVHKGHLGQDTGRTNIGVAVILDDGKPIYMA
ncbi:MAG: RRXRR domain-containing protein, partial [Spirochaetaceae bacterium]|nr:RRXRR domain-containing protein [Spirochaetaceae bacterium]